MCERKSNNKPTVKRRKHRNMRTKTNISLRKIMSDIKEANMEEEHVYVAEGESSRWGKGDRIMEPVHFHDHLAC